MINQEAAREKSFGAEKPRLGGGFSPVQPQEDKGPELMAPGAKQRGPVLLLEAERVAKAARQTSKRRQKHSPVFFPDGQKRDRDLSLRNQQGLLNKSPLGGDTSAGVRKLREISLRSQEELLAFLENSREKTTMITGKPARIHRVDPLDRFLNVRLQLPPTTHAQADAQVRLRKKLDYSAVGNDLTGRSTGSNTNRSQPYSHRNTGRSSSRSISTADPLKVGHINLLGDKHRHHDLLDGENTSSGWEPPPAPIVKLGFGLKPLVGGNSFKRQAFLAYQDSAVAVSLPDTYHSFFLSSCTMAPAHLAVILGKRSNARCQ